LKALRDEGIRVVMLTGDSRTTAQAVGRKLGIDDVMVEVLPDQKASAVKKFQDAHLRFLILYPFWLRSDPGDMG
jgi:P-type Cu+ transporter